MISPIGGEEVGQRAARAFWRDLDIPWQEAFRQAGEAFRTGNIGVGACAWRPDGTLVHAARNRVTDTSAPAGEVCGSSLAHAEVNVVARLSYGAPKDLVLTTTLEPCLQCSAVIRLGPVAVVRFAGSDPLWSGCHDFSPLSGREAARTKVAMVGPREDELGVFGTLLSRFWDHGTRVQEYLRTHGEGDLLDLVTELREDGSLADLATLEVEDAFVYLWPRLTPLARRQE